MRRRRRRSGAPRDEASRRRRRRDAAARDQKKTRRTYGTYRATHCVGEREPGGCARFLLRRGGCRGRHATRRQPHDGSPGSRASRVSRCLFSSGSGSGSERVSSFRQQKSGSFAVRGGNAVPLGGTPKRRSRSRPSRQSRQSRQSRRVARDKRRPLSDGGRPKRNVHAHERTVSY